LTSSAFHTDQYELTMLDAALGAGTAGQRVVFEMFTRRVPLDRRYGVVAGVDRFLDALELFTFGDEEVAWLEKAGIVSGGTIDWLANYRFSGDIHAYPEGELFTAGSPVLTVEGTFGEAVLLETVALSILNHDSAVAAAASVITEAAGGRPVIEMGSRRTDTEAAVAAARAAYVGGMASTSNLEAGRSYGIPTAGTSAHAFVLLFETERAAFQAQVDALGVTTTILVDTFDMPRGIATAVEVAGPALAAIRIDSGDPVEESWRARRLLDSLGATSTRILVTGDLDAEAIRRLDGCPVDGFGVGTSVVTGLGHPTAEFVYKLVEVEGRPVAKASPGKRTRGGRKWAWRGESGALDVVGFGPDQRPPGDRPLQEHVVQNGRRASTPDVEASRRRHRLGVEALGGRELRLSGL
jgi:nicotinate phosphoribosyltransferase